jgi:ubiquinone/menaquinone biosynthesis C-methylase UbiE
MGDPKRNTELKYPFFDVQAEAGITKHGGGLKATRDLIKLCHISKDSYVLDVGCGVGVTTCLIAKKYGCRVVGTDIFSRMIDRAKGRVKRMGLEDKVKLQVANAQNLPFKNCEFDIVISQSVTAFTEDKAKVVQEYARVTKTGGFIGLNEVTWIEINPPREVVEYLSRAIGGVQPETSNEWKNILESSGLQDIVVKTFKFGLIYQTINEIRLMGLGESLRVLGRFFSLFITSPPYRIVIKKMLKDAVSMPRKILQYLGYGIYVGRK